MIIFFVLFNTNYKYCTISYTKKIRHDMKMQPELHVSPSIYRGSFPRFIRPKIIGYIGLENLKFAKRIDERNVQFDLNLHYEKAVRKPENLDVKITELLKFLLENEVRLEYPIESSLDKAQFFCYRGLLTCIACTPYENREPWKIAAILFKGNIYLCARDTDEKKLRKQNVSEQEKLFTSWGYKFEQYILSDRPDSEPNPNTPVNETDEFSLVYTTILNKHTVVYGAEMDGIKCSPNITEPPVQRGTQDVIDYLSTKEFIELKTNRHIEYPNQDKNFRRFKTKKWWCQSFLVGIDTILCGFRNDNGIVEELKLFNVKDLAKMSQKFWDPNICFNFLDTFLTYVKRCLARKIRSCYGEKALNKLNTLPLISLMFEWYPEMPVVVNENYNHDDDPILEKWFVDNYMKSKENNIQ